MADELRVDLVASGNLVQALQQAIAALQQAAGAAAPLTAALQANTTASAAAAQSLQRVTAAAQQTATAKTQLNDTVRVSIGLWTALPGPLREVGGAFASLHVNITKTQEAMLATAGAMSAIGTGIAGGLGEAVHEAATFQRTLAEIQVVAQSTGDELAAFRAKALELGTTTQFTSQQVAAGLKNLLQAGLSAKEAMGAIEPATQAALIGNQSLEATTKTLANTMRQFGFDGAQAAHIIDVMTVAAQGSTLEFSQFGDLITNLRGRTQQLGVPFEEVIALQMEMVNAGVPAAAASTALGTAMDRLGKATKTGTDEASAGIRALGLNVWDASGRFVGFTALLDQIAAKLPSMTQEEQTHALALLGGARASGAFSLVLQQQQTVMKDGNEVTLKGTDLLRYWTDQLKNSQGVSAQAAATIGGTLDAQLKNLHGSLQEAAIQLGTQFLPVLQALTPQVQGLVNVFVAAPPAFQQAAAAGLAATAIFGTLAGTATVAAIALGALGTSLAAVALPLVAVGVAAAALTLAWQTNWGDLQGTVTRVLAAIQPDIDRLTTLIGNFGQGVQDVLQQAAAVWTFFGGSAQTASDGVSIAGDLIAATIHTLIDVELQLAALWGAAWQEISIRAVDAINVVLPLLEQLGDWLGTTLPPVVEAVQTQWDAFWAEAGPTLTAFWAVAQPILSDFKDWVGTAIPQALGWLKDRLGDVWGFIGPLLGQLKDLVGPLIGALASAIGSKAHEVNAALREALDTAAVEGTARTGMQTVGEAMAAGAVAGIVEGSPGIDAALRRAVRAAIEAAKAEAGISSPSRETAEQIGAPMAEGVAAGFTEAADATGAAIGGSLRTAIQGAVPAAVQAAQAAGQQIGQGLTVGAQAAIEATGSWGARMNPMLGRYGAQPGAPASVSAGGWNPYTDPIIGPYLQNHPNALTEVANQIGGPDVAHGLASPNQQAYMAELGRRAQAETEFQAGEAIRNKPNAGVRSDALGASAAGAAGSLDDLATAANANNAAYTSSVGAVSAANAAHMALAREWGDKAASLGEGMDFVGAAAARAGLAMISMGNGAQEAAAAAQAATEQWKVVIANGQALMAGSLRNAGVAGGVTEKGLTYTQIMNGGGGAAGGGAGGSNQGIVNLNPGTYYGLPVVSPVTGGTLRGYADGGMIYEPHYLVNARSGQTTGLMAEQGPEAIGGGGGRVQLTVNVSGADALRDPRFYEQLLDRGLTQALRKRGLVT